MDDERCEEPLTDNADADEIHPVRRRFVKQSRVSDKIGSSRATTLARPDECDWKELCKSRSVVAIETATDDEDGGACSLATAFIFCAMISKPVTARTPIEGMTRYKNDGEYDDNDNGGTMTVDDCGRDDDGGQMAWNGGQMAWNGGHEWRGWEEGNKPPKPCK